MAITAYLQLRRWRCAAAFMAGARNADEGGNDLRRHRR